MAPQQKPARPLMANDDDVVVVDNNNNNNTNDAYTTSLREGHHLDPSDWSEFRTDMHAVLDACLDRMQSYRRQPWQPPRLRSLEIAPPPNNSVAAISQDDETQQHQQQHHQQRDILERLTREIMPTAMGNTHPAFWGWVNGAGIPVSVAADLVASTMNSNCGGRHHGAAAVEQACIYWLLQTAGMMTTASVNADDGEEQSTTTTASTTSSTRNDEIRRTDKDEQDRLLLRQSSSSSLSSSSQQQQQQQQEPVVVMQGSTVDVDVDSDEPFGVLTTGTSQATIIALTVARYRLFPDIRTAGLVRDAAGNNRPPIRVYAVKGTHSCLTRALEVLGHGSDCLCLIPAAANSKTGGMDLDLLQQALDRDLAAGIVPLAVVGTAGSVGTGAFDDLQGLADICHSHGNNTIWLHVDAAFGFWTRLATCAPWKSLAAGLHRANSVALDAHKWPGVAYDVGACLIYSRQLHRAALQTRHAYLLQTTTTTTADNDGSTTTSAAAAEGLAGGDADSVPWFTDYSTDLSRSFRALKLWTVLQSYSANTLGAVVTDNCKQAALMGRLVEASPLLNLARPVVSNVCCFTVTGPGKVEEIAALLQLQGQAVFSTITLEAANDDNDDDHDGVITIPCMRAAIVNHRTTCQDVRAAIAAVEKTVLMIIQAQQQQQHQ